MKRKKNIFTVLFTQEGFMKKQPVHGQNKDEDEKVESLK